MIIPSTSRCFRPIFELDFFFFDDENHSDDEDTRNGSIDMFPLGSIPTGPSAPEDMVRDVLRGNRSFKISVKDLLGEIRLP